MPTANTPISDVTSRITPELALVDPDLGEALRARLLDPGDCLVLSPLAPVIPRAVAPGLAPQPSLPPAQRAAPALAPQPGLRPALRAVAPAPAPQPRSLPTQPAYSRIVSYASTAVTALVAVAILAVPLLAFVSPPKSSRPQLLEREVRPEPPGKNRPAAGSFRGNQDAPAAKRAHPARPRPPTQAPPAGSAGSKQGNPGTDAGGRLEWHRVAGADLYNVIFVRGTTRIDRWVQTNHFEFRAGHDGGRVANEFWWYVYPLFRTTDRSFRFGELILRGTVRMEPDALPPATARTG
jgi:hypothetical protein